MRRKQEEDYISNMIDLRNCIAIAVVAVVAFYWHKTGLVRLTCHIQYKNKYNINTTHRSQDTHRGLALYSKSQSFPGREIFKVIWTKVCTWICFESSQEFLRYLLYRYCCERENHISHYCIAIAQCGKMKFIVLVSPLLSGGRRTLSVLHRHCWEWEDELSCNCINIAEGGKINFIIISSPLLSVHSCIVSVRLGRRAYMFLYCHCWEWKDELYRNCIAITECEKINFLILA